MPKRYPREFREDVVRVARVWESGVTIEQSASDFRVYPMTLQKWLRLADLEDGVKAGATAEQSAELREGSKRIPRLGQQNDVCAGTPRICRRRTSQEKARLDR